MFIFIGKGDSTPKSKRRLARHLKKIGRGSGLTAKKRKEREEDLRHYYFHPIDLNEKVDALAELGIASASQIKALVRYRATYGRLANCYELQAVPSWDPTTIRHIQPFVCVHEPWLTRVKEVACKDSFNLYLRPKGLFQTSSKYFGDPSQCLLRYETQREGYYRLVIIGSKAPYEPYYWDGKQENGYGVLSYWGGYALIENVGLCKKCLIGDYEIGLGQGLIMGTTFGMDKSKEVISIMKASYQGIKPNASFQRKNSFQGMAATFQQDNWQLLVYHSKRNLDITLHKKKGNPPYIKTLGKRGITYTNSKNIEKKDSVTESVIGGALVYKPPSNTLNIGVQGVCSHFSVPLFLGQGLNHSHFFSGQENRNAGVFANKLWRNYHFFGEIAASKNKSVAALGGVMASFGEKAALSSVFYYYPPDFHALYGHAFSRQGSYNRNKEGCYVAFQYKITPKISLRGYLDTAQYMVQHASLHEAPADEQEYMSCAIYKPTRAHTYTLKLKQTHKTKNRKGSKLIRPLSQVEQRKVLTLKADYPLKKGCDAYTQAQLVAKQDDQGKPSYGAACKQFFYYKNKTLDVKFWTTLYYTQSQGSAVYFYVHSLRGGMNYPRRSGKGLAIGLLLRYRLTKNLRLSLLINFDSCGLPKVNLQLQYRP
ncbi:MAG: hypothetical protein AAF335_01960 [Bacteroidota bacterium]